jgi:putative DNA primase/helicase
MDRSDPASGNHAYLAKKGIEPGGFRQMNHDFMVPRSDPALPAFNIKGFLLVPRYDADDRLRAFQFISPKGQKYFQANAQKSATFAIFGNPDISKLLVLCEGAATGKSIHTATGHAVYAALDSGNLLSTAKAMRSKYPDKDIVVAADQDHWHFSSDGFIKAGRPDRSETRGDDPHWQEWRDLGYLDNPGVEKAQEAAAAINATCAFPGFSPDDPDKLTDFNDLHKYHGIHAVKSAFPSSENALDNSGPEIDHGFDR